MRSGSALRRWQTELATEAAATACFPLESFARLPVILRSPPVAAETEAAAAATTTAAMPPPPQAAKTKGDAVRGELRCMKVCLISAYFNL